ncbi:hypothetical protein EVAR_84173_1 [Eumeta japonica]|uniref:Uncharacterized protein n=1 Tax=Eumeta variegata TaxID=151549 RepID=A0A4C1ZUQ0_EUMVA|nr:hypothetical protein EVAR_84173_1 [Eumeta japonica]
MQHERGHGGHQNKMRSRKEIKVEAAKAANLLIMKGYRKRARNQLQCHPVLELSPSVHKRFLEAGKLYIDLQKSQCTTNPLVQCAKCLGFGHTKLLRGKTATCSYCADKTHEWEKCPRRKQNEEPKCKNCWENGIKTEANHEAFSNKCKKWTQNDSDDSSESPEIKVATAELLQLATEKGISIALVQEPYVGNQGILKQNPGTKVIQCTVGRQKPVKAAIIVFGDKVEVESKWRVDRTATTSDHNAIVFNLRLSGPIKPMEPITTRRYNTNKADWTEFCLQLRNTLQKYGIAERSNERRDLRFGSEQQRIHSCYPGTELSALKRRLAQKRRIRNAAPEKKGRNRRLPYGQTIYTQKAEIAQTESWKELPDTLLRNSEGKTLSHTNRQNFSRTHFTRRLCIDGYAIPHPNERKDRRQTCRRPKTVEDDPPFTRVELKAVLRELNPKKAPGPDGLTADICIAAIESEMEVFLAIANKCLELALPHALEDRTCRHNTETWKRITPSLNPTGR